MAVKQAYKVTTHTECQHTQNVTRAIRNYVTKHVLEFKLTKFFANCH